MLEYTPEMRWLCMFMLLRAGDAVMILSRVFSLDGTKQTAEVVTLWWWGQHIIQVICIIIHEVHRASLCHVLGVQQVQHTIYGPVVRDLQYTSAIRTLWLRVNF